nr:MAG TPA: hypothetical protein [Caudoviricetes sp.]
MIDNSSFYSSPVIRILHFLFLTTYFLFILNTSVNLAASYVAEVLTTYTFK